jgi:hypothetical protein
MEMMEASIADMARMLGGPARGVDPAALEVEIEHVDTVGSVLLDESFKLELARYEPLDDPWFLDDDSMPDVITDDAYQTARVYALRPGSLSF